MSLEVVHRRITLTNMIFEENVGAGGRNLFLSTGDKVMTFLGSNSEFLLGRKLKIWRELQPIVAEQQGSFVATLMMSTIIPPYMKLLFNLGFI